VLCCGCSRLDFTVYAVNRLPFVKASCRSLNAPPSHGRAVHHPFVAFFTSFARAKAAACWLSESGEEVYVHRFRANKSVEGRWHPFRWPLNVRNVHICTFFDLTDLLIRRNATGCCEVDGSCVLSECSLILLQAWAVNKPSHADVPLCRDGLGLQGLACGEGAGSGH